MFTAIPPAGAAASARAEQAIAQLTSPIMRRWNGAKIHPRLGNPLAQYRQSGKTAVAWSTSGATSRQGWQERKMSSTPVQRDQFEVWPKGITHKPTGSTYTPHPGAPYSGLMKLGQLGNVLMSGEDYRPLEAQTMMQQLWAEYVDANPRLFEVHD
jgi:hypothetical protein